MRYRLVSCEPDEASKGSADTLIRARSVHSGAAPLCVTDSSFKIRYCTLHTCTQHVTSDEGLD